LRKLALFFFLLQIASAAHAATRVTVSQLEQMLSNARVTPDLSLALELSDLELTERLTSARADPLSAELPGPYSRRSLLVLADMSAFLDPPADETAANPPPDLDAQRKMIALTSEYLNKTLHRMPDFFATRETTSFQSKVLLGVPSQALLPAGKEAWTAFYSDGGEKIRSGRRHSKKSGMTTNGEFGNILETVMDDAAIGDLVWNRWEKGSEELLAVYRFAITKRRNSHYSVNGLPTAVKALLEPGEPLTIAESAVEYGPVDLGGKVYICPLKGVAFSEGTRLRWLNDVVFKDYHLFRANMRILPTISDHP
jgi:hypothetical protein